MSQQQTRPLEVTDRRGFINPYNFVSTPERTGPALDGGLGCHAPAGHRRYGEDLLSGRLRISLTARTPLLLCEAERKAKDETSPGGTYLAVKTGPDGQSPLLNGSSIKGMLRSAYETITNSRLAVFTGHDLPLAMREPIGSKARTFVGRVEDTPDAAMGTRRIRVCVPVYIKADKLGGEAAGDTVPVYAKVIKCSTTVRKRDGSTSTVTVWRADELLSESKAADHPLCTEDEAIVKAYVFRTGKTFGNKESERLVVMSERDGRGNWEDKGRRFFKWHLTVDEARESAWNGVIDSYAQTHLDKRFPAQDGTVHGTYITAPDTWRGLRPGRTMFVKEMDAGIVLTPAAKGRIPYSHAPADLLPRTHHPAKALDELSPADRVFGWASAEAKGNTQAAYRGQIRVETAHCKPPKGKGAVQELAPIFQMATLNGPKAGQARFYTGDQEQKPPDEDIPTPGTAFAVKSKTLRGRKVYLTQPELLEDMGKQYFAWNSTGQKPMGSGKDTRYREYIKSKDDEDKHNDKMDVFVKSWVRIGTVFTTDLYFTNLNPLELGALVWLMDLPAGAMFHLGRGKPFGFGTMEVSYDPDASELFDHQALVSRYGGAPATSDKSFVSVRDDFAKAQEENDSLGRIRDEFLAAAFGVKGIPTHYPRLGPEAGPLPGPSTEPYKWWVENSDPNNAGKYLPALSAFAAPVLPYTIPPRPAGNVNRGQSTWRPGGNNGGAGQRGNGRQPGRR